MGTSTSVLIVDDDDGIRESLVDLLTDAGHTVREACHGQAALDALRTGPIPGAVLLDLMMPGVDGWQVLDAIIREHLVPIDRVIVVTAHRNPKLPPGVRYLGKPMEAATVLAAVGDASAAAQSA